MGKINLVKRSINLEELDSHHPAWYVMLVSFQDKFKDTLLKQADKQGLRHLIHEVFIPTRVETKTVRVNGKDKQVQEKTHVWPNNYVLVRLVLNAQTWDLCQNVSTALGWLKSGGTPSTIAESEVFLLKQSCGVFETLAATTDVAADLKVGTPIRLRNHLFGGMLGTLEGGGPTTWSVRLANGFHLDVDTYQLEVQDE